MSLHNPRYPLSNTYDDAWVFENQMGPNALWLMEALTQALPLSPGMRVLDLGCGRAMTSIFLAQQFGVSVWATDLWIDASSNASRVRAAGCAGRVYPVHAEAHQLPYAEGFFDAIVSVDAYHYFGTDDLYIGYISSFLRSGGQIGVVVPGILQEVGVDLQQWWDWEFCSFHGPSWWQTHWAKTGRVRVDVADAVEGGWEDWLRFDQASLPTVDGWRRDAAQRSIAMLTADQGRTFCFSRMVATKP